MRPIVVIALLEIAGTACGQAQSRPAETLLAGRVVDSGGQAVPRGAVRVRLRTPNDQPVYATAASFDQRVALDSDGRFSIAVPRSGKYLVLVEGEGLAAARDWVNPGDSL